MKKSKKALGTKANQSPIKESSVSYDDTILEQMESETVQLIPDLALDITENDEDAWEAMESRLDTVTAETIRYNTAQVDARAWLQASKEFASMAKQVAETATTKKEIFKIDAMVDAFDRDMKQRKVNVQPCRLHCQNAIRDAYARLA